jgi:hypothetical protein
VRGALLKIDETGLTNLVNKYKRDKIVKDENHGMNNGGWRIIFLKNWNSFISITRRWSGFMKNINHGMSGLEPTTKTMFYHEEMIETWL